MSPDVLEVVHDAKRRQREEALKRGNRIRSRRAEIKARLAVGELDIREVITDPPGILRGAKVVDILEASPRIGPEKAKRLLLSCGINNPLVEFGWMSEARLKRVAAAIPDYKPHATRSKKIRAMADKAPENWCRACGVELREGRSTCGKCSKARATVSA